MRVLLDECLPRRLKRSLPGHEVLTVPEAGWASKENGELLGLAAERFDAFLTVDRNLSFRQNLRNLRIAVVILVARGNRFTDLQPLMSQVAETLPGLTRGQVVRIGR
jgi:predicted nuclease of predicted toxin-antitoxin system